MTERDLNIILMVYEYEGCGVEHIRKLFFQSATNRSIPCYRRLAYLVKQGYLRSVLLPALNKHFLTPGTKARSVLTHLLKGGEMKRFRIESPLYIMHKLALCDARVSLELASKETSVFLLTEWVNESTLRHSPVTVEDPETNKQTLLIPDAGFTLLSQATGSRADFLLEMDLSTISLKALRHRVRGYLLRHTPCPVLFVVPDSRRQHAIAAVAREEAALLKANPTTIWITTKPHMTPETVLTAPWLVVGRQTPVSFQELAKPIEPPLSVGERESAVVFAGHGGQLG
jgi:hypothetical protein